MPAPQPDQPCSIDECGKTARKAGLCWGHYKRRQRRQPVGVPLREQGTTELARLMLAFERYQEAENRIGEKDAAGVLRRAEWRLEQAIQAYRGRAVRRLPVARAPVNCDVCGKEQSRKTCSTCRTRRIRAKKIGLPLRSYLTTLDEPKPKPKRRRGPIGECAVFGCGKPISAHGAHGLCSTHYSRAWKLLPLE